MIELLAAMLLQAQGPNIRCDTELNIPTGPRRRDPKTFTVTCPEHGPRYEGLQEAAEAYMAALDLDFRHADWMQSAEQLYFRRNADGNWVPDGDQMMIYSPPIMPDRLINRDYRDLECVWMAYPQADGLIEVEDYHCLLDGGEIPENLERTVRRTLNRALETSRILPREPGACVQDVVRVSTFVYRYHYAFGYDGEGYRAAPDSRFDPLCPPAGIEAGTGSEPKQTEIR